MSTIEKCPICDGVGRVLGELYPDLSVAREKEWVICRACEGKGIIIVPVSYLPAAPYVPWNPPVPPWIKPWSPWNPIVTWAKI